MNTGGTRENAPTVPIGAPVVTRSDVPDAQGWRVYRVAPNGAVIYDRWIEQDPARAELALTELRAAAERSLAAALRQAVERQPDHARGKSSSGGSPTRRMSGQVPRRSPGRGRPGGGAPAQRAGRDDDRRNRPARLVARERPRARPAQPGAGDVAARAPAAAGPGT